MSNLNRLVQPECGGPNPLVKAAQQIARNSGISRIRPPVPGSTSQLDFSKEFVTASGLQQPPPNTTVQQQPFNNAVQQQPQQQSHQPQHSNLAAFTPIGLRLQQAGTPAATTSRWCGDQLEEKYRNDIAQTDVSRHDDVEFWQSISQAYIGPTTFDSISRSRLKRRGESQVAATTTTKTDQDSDKQTQGDDEATRSQKDREKEWSEGLAKLDEEFKAAKLVESARFDEYVFNKRNPLKNQSEDPFSEGLKRLELGDIPSAALLFETAVQIQPNNAQAWHYLGTTQAQNENDGSAIRALKNCLKLDPKDQSARLAISVSLVNETKYREACKHLLEWLTAHDLYKNIPVSLAEFEELGEDYYEYVRDKFIEAARMSPNNPDPDVQNSLGVLFNMRAEYDKAVDCFKAALSVQSGDSLLWNRLGATLANSNKSDEAVIAYRRALEIAPGFLRSRYNLAISLIHLNIYEEAARQLVQILNTQAAVRVNKTVRPFTRYITSTSIWNTLRTVATLMNRPELYPVVQGCDLAKCNELLLGTNESSTSREDI